MRSSRMRRRCENCKGECKVQSSKRKIGSFFRKLFPIAGLILIVGCSATPPTTQPIAAADAVASGAGDSPAPASPAASQPAAADAPGEMLQPRSSFAGYGVESYRLISEKD